MRGSRAGWSLPAGLVVEPAEQALALERGRVHLRRTRHGSAAERSRRTRRRAGAQVGVEIFQAERPLGRKLILEAEAGSPTGRGGALCERTNLASALKRRTDIGCGKAAFDIRQPLPDRVTDL